MSGRKGMVCAAALLFAAVGCMPQSFLALTGSDSHKQVVAGSVGKVAGILETGLTDAGIHVVVKRLDGEVRLAGQAKSGKVFCFDVKREKGEGGEKSAVTVRWGREPDEPLWQMVVDLLAAPAPDEDNPPDAK